MMTLIFLSSRRRHTRYWRDWSSDVCSSDLAPRRRGRGAARGGPPGGRRRLGVVSLAQRSGARVGVYAGAGSRSDRKSVVKGKRVDLGGRRITNNNIEDP